VDKNSIVIIMRDFDNCIKTAEIIKEIGCKIIIEPLFFVKKEKIILKNELLKLNNFHSNFHSNFANKYCIKNGNYFSIITSQNAQFSVINSGISKENLIFAISKNSVSQLINCGFNNIIFAKEKNANSLMQEIADYNNRNLLDKNNNFGIYFMGSSITLDFQKLFAYQQLAICNILSYKIIPVANFSSKMLEFFHNLSVKFYQNSTLQNKNKLLNCQDKLSSANVFGFEQLVFLLFSLNNAKIFIDLAKKNSLFGFLQNSQIICISNNIKNFMQNYGFYRCSLFSHHSILKKLT